MFHNPLNALRKVFATKKLLFICIVFTLGALATLVSTINDSPDLTTFTVPVIEYEVNLLDYVGEEAGEILQMMTNVILVINIISILPQLLTAIALWLIRRGKVDDDASAKGACLGLSFIKVQAFYKTLTCVIYALATGIIAVVALLVGSRIDQSGKTVMILLGVAVLLLGYFILVITYHTKLMTMMITVTNTLRTGKNQVRRFVFVSVMNWFFAIYYFVGGFGGEIADFISGLCIALVYLFMNFVFKDYQKECGYADVDEVKRYMNALASDASRRETAVVLGFETVVTPEGEVFAPTVKGLLKKQFFGISLSSTRRAEAEGTLVYVPVSAASSMDEPLFAHADFSSAQRLEVSVLPLFAETLQDRFLPLGFSMQQQCEAEGLLCVKDAEVLRDSISDTLLLRLSIRNLSPVVASGVRISFRAESCEREALGYAEDVTVVSDIVAGTEDVMLSELGITIPQRTAKLTVTLQAFLFADGLKKEGINLSFTLLSSQVLERERQEAQSAQERQEARKIKLFADVQQSLKYVRQTLKDAASGVNRTIGVSLGFVDPLKKPLSELDVLEEQLGEFSDDKTACELIQECRQIREEYVPIRNNMAPKQKKQRIVSISALVVAMAIFVVALFPTVIVPAVKLQKALDMKEDGELIAAYYLLKDTNTESARAEREKLKNEIEYFVLPEHITVIDEGEFCGFTEIKEITLHEGVRSVGFGAFRECNQIESLVLHDTNITISHLLGEPNAAFFTYPNLKSVTYLGGTELASCALYGCVSLSEIHLPNTLETIGSSAFSDCTSLRTLVIPDSVTKYDSSILQGCVSLEELVIPDSEPDGGWDGDPSPYFRVPTIGEENSLKRVTLTRATRLGLGAFEDLSSLEEIVLPEGLVEIGAIAFRYWTALKELNIPSTV